MQCGFEVSDGFEYKLFDKALKGCVTVFPCGHSQDKIKALEIELDEERSSVELLNDRVTRSRDQVPH